MKNQQRKTIASRNGLKFLPALGAVLVVAVSLCASRAMMQQATDAAPAGGKGAVQAVTAVNALLDSLDAGQRAKVLLPYDSAKKPSWSNLPVTMVPRNGIRLGDLNKKQRSAALAALASVLSKEGYQKVIDIMNADDQLVRDKTNRMKFGTENFYMAVFGNPSPKTPWMVQFGGHHLGINVTMVGNKTVLTPTHTGTQPFAFTRKGKKVRPLGPEYDLAFKLLNQLDAKQRAKAIRSKKPRNLVLGPGQDKKTVAAEGIKGSDLTEKQRSTLHDLIGAWVNILPKDSAAKRMAEIKGKLNDTYFAWYGPTKAGSAVYFRVQGPTVVIEYAPQRSNDHIHTIIRNPVNDYAKELTAP